LIDVLIKFLEPFQEATLALEVIFTQQFSMYLPIVKFLKERASYAMHGKFIATPLHKVAFMFNPKFKVCVILMKAQRLSD